jgi:cytochrome c
MPFGKEGSLKPDEVYAITAYLLFKNGVIPENQIMDAQSLPQVQMPNRNGYVLPEWKHGAPRPFANKP